MAQQDADSFSTLVEPGLLGKCHCTWVPKEGLGDNSRGALRRDDHASLDSGCPGPLGWPQILHRPQRVPSVSPRACCRPVPKKPGGWMMDARVGCWEEEAFYFKSETFLYPLQGFFFSAVSATAETSNSSITNINCKLHFCIVNSASSLCI